MSNCAHADCNTVTSGKSKYCETHKIAAREAWKAMIAAKSGEKDAREQKWADLHAEAHAAGLKAAEAHTPTPMHVIERLNPFDDSSPVVRRYEPVMDGVCGFAWVTITPGNSSFAIWLKKKGIARNAYQGGVMVWVKDFRQSMELKEAYAQAYADVLRVNGIKAHAMSRMD